MIGLYRSLLYFYPPAYRRDFGDEMASVFLQVQREHAGSTIVSRAALWAHEVSGLIAGALQAHLCSLFGINDSSPFGRFNMRPQFRFPRSTVFLMCVILAAVAFAIEKAQHIQATLTGMPTREQTIVPLLVTFGLVYAAAAAVWALLFALNRSGTHRLSRLTPPDPTEEA